MLANSSSAAHVGLAAEVFGACAMILLLPPPCCSCLPSAETSHTNLSSAVSQPSFVCGVGVEIGAGGRLWSSRKRYAPHIQPHTVAGNCLTGITGPLDGVGWDGGMLTGLVSAGEKSSVMRVKSCSCHLCNFFSAFLLRGSELCCLLLRG